MYSRNMLIKGLKDKIWLRLKQIKSKSISGSLDPKHLQPTTFISQPFPKCLFKTTYISQPFPVMFVEYLRVKNSQQPLPPPFFLQSHRNPITYFSSSAASKVPLSHVTCGKNAQAAGCSKTHFHLTCARVRIQGYDDLRYYSKHKVTLNPTFSVCLFPWPLLLCQTTSAFQLSFSCHSPVYNFCQNNLFLSSFYSPFLLIQ